MSYLEDYIGELLLLDSVSPSRVIEKINNLSRSVQQANDSFLDTKLLNRTLVCNIVSDSIKQSEPLPELTPVTEENNDENDDEEEEEQEDDEERKETAEIAENKSEQAEVLLVC